MVKQTFYFFHFYDPRLGQHPRHTIALCEYYSSCGRNDTKAETPVLWPPHAKSWLIGKDSDAGSDWGQEEKGTTEDKMAGWHHRLDGRESEWTPGVGDGQGRLACCDSWGSKELDTTERLNWTVNDYRWIWFPWPSDTLGGWERYPKECE